MLLPALSFLLLVSFFTTTKAEITLEEGVLVLDNDNFQVILDLVHGQPDDRNPILLPRSESHITYNTLSKKPLTCVCNETITKTH